MASIGSLLRQGFALVALVLLVALGVRAFQASDGPPLRPWHTIVPAELTADAIAKGDWNSYVAAESRLLHQVHTELRAQLEAGDRTSLNRYHEASLVRPATHARDWNRSFVLEPDGEPVGVAVLLHGLTDSPYSMHNLAELYRQRGYVAIAPRMPGHGTVPAGLVRVGREQWSAAAAMALAEASRRARARQLPVHLVGYSNGAALGLLHVLREVERGAAVEADRLVLLSPMIEVSGSARYIGLAALPALLPRFARAAWIDLLPEYNPFKYNSFPVRAARESYLLTTELHAAVESVARQQRTDRLPPILAFQSVVDDTVEASGVMTRVFDHLGREGDELVLFDVNHNRFIDPMLAPGTTDWSRNVLQRPRPYTLTLVGTTSLDDARVVARTRPAGTREIRQDALGLDYPAQVYSLSHIALPFPADDVLYGDRGAQPGIVQLGSIAVRGERDVLAVPEASRARLSFNPFYDYLSARIAATTR